MEIINRPLPEFCYSSRPITKMMGLVVHYLSAINVDPVNAYSPDTCFDLLMDLNSPGDERGLVMPTSGQGRLFASYHWMIDRNGNVYQLMPLGRRAYHAGRSQWKGYDNLNEWTHGVALLASEGSGFTDEQYAALTMLAAQDMAKHHYDHTWIVGHDEVAPERKKDPGKLFDWERLQEPLRSIVI